MLQTLTLNSFSLSFQRYPPAYTHDVKETIFFDESVILGCVNAMKLSCNFRATLR